MKIIIELKPCVSRENTGNLNDEITDMMDGAYRDIIKSVEVIV